ATLQLYIEDTIFAYQGLGPAISFTIAYNASQAEPGMFGRNWRFSYESSIVQAGEKVYLQKGSGQRLSFKTGTRGGSFPHEAISLDSKYHRLLDFGGFWIFTEKKTRLSYRYDKQPGSTQSWLASISDLHGNSVRFNYNLDGTLGTVTDLVRRSTYFEYDQEGRCISLTTPHGKKASFVYDQNGDLIQTVDLLGIETHYEYEDHSLVRMIVDSDQKTTQFTYQNFEANKIVSAVTNPAGHTRYYEMKSLNPRKVTITDTEDHARMFTYRDGLVQKVIDPQGIVHEWGYARGLPKFYKDPNANISRYKYNEYGNVASFTDPRGNTSHFVFDEYDNPVEQTNALGEVIRYSYDEHRRLSRITFPSGGEQTFEYDPLGQLIASIDRAGRSSAFEYDRFGNLSLFTKPSGAASRYGYDDFGLNLTTITDGRGNTTHFEYDANSRRIKQTYPDGSSKQTTYGCCARSSIIDENGNRTVFRRDPLLNITETTDPLGNSTLRIHDRRRNITEIVDALGRSVTFEYDGAGRIVRQTFPNNQELEMMYDLNSNLIQVVDPLNNAIGFKYDANNNMTLVQDATGDSEQFIWDPLGRLMSVVNARGTRVGLAYNLMNSISEKTYDGSVIAQYGYNP
ncbi:MAG: DUF6531 domain-containing protein, partial [Anaerolineaceae bacterium]|nr:DUF6531 domain-containing protein [Anaerolineaceae bacterium]